MKNVENTFWIRHKWLIQSILILSIILICSGFQFTLNVIGAVILVATVVILYQHVERKQLSHYWGKQQSNQCEFMMALCKSSSDIVVFNDLNGKYLYCNHIFLETFDKTMKDVEGKSVRDLFPIELATEVEKLLKRALNGDLAAKIVKASAKEHYKILVTPLIIANSVVGTITIAKNVTNEENKKKALAEHDKMLRSLIDGLPSATYIKDTSGNLIYANKIAQDFLGFSNNSTSNKVNYTKELAKEVAREDRIVITEKRSLQTERTITFKCGNERRYRVYKFPMYNRSDDVEGICVVARDIEAEKLVEEQKQAHISTLTHDLKTPTLAQMNALNMLLNGSVGKLKKEQKEILELTKESCNYMYNMLTTLLDTYKLEGNDYVLNYTPCHLVNLLADICEEEDQYLKEKNLEVRIVPQKGTNDELVCDIKRVKRAIRTLIKNSITYAYKDTCIYLYLSSRGSKIRMTIKSNGQNVNKSLLRGIFQKQLNDRTKYNTIGFNICMYNARQIIEAHGGSIYATIIDDNTGICSFTLQRDCSVADKLIHINS